MVCRAHPFTWLFFLHLAFSVSFAERPLFAVLPVRVDGAEAKNLFTREDVNYLSDAIRSEASRILGRQVQILSQMQIEKLVMANAQECAGAGCLAGFLKTISADYGMQPTMRVAGGKLRLTLEIASNEATLGMRDVAKPKNEDGKNDMIEDGKGVAAELFTQMLSELNSTPVEAPQAPPVPLAPPEVKAFSVEIELLDGPGSISFDGQLVCSHNARCAQTLQKGSHAVIASREGFRDSSFTVTVPAGSNRYTLALVNKFGTLTLQSFDAQGGDVVPALVWVNGSRAGETPWSGLVPVDAATILVRAQGYTDVEISERPSPGMVSTLRVELNRNLPPVVAEASLVASLEPPPPEPVIEEPKPLYTPQQTPENTAHMSGKRKFALFLWGTAALSAGGGLYFNSEGLRQKENLATFAEDRDLYGMNVTADAIETAKEFRTISYGVSAGAALLGFFLWILPEGK